jgi:hypothetical protein
MVNPIYMLAIGGLSGLLCRRKKAVADRPRVRRPAGRGMRPMLLPTPSDPIAAS